MKASDMLLDFHAQVEGYSHTTYYDHIGKLTIGIGHANQKTARFKEGDIWDDDKIRDTWQKDVASAVEIANNALHGFTIPQTFFDAVVDIIFNTGQKPVTMIKYLKQGDLDNARAQILRWIFANGYPALGLMRRRIAMYVYTLGGNWEAILKARASSKDLTALNDVILDYGYEIAHDDDGVLCWVELD